MRKILIALLLISVAGHCQVLPTFVKSVRDFRVTADHRLFASEGNSGIFELAKASDYLSLNGGTMTGTLIVTHLQTTAPTNIIGQVSMPFGRAYINKLFSNQISASPQGSNLVFTNYNETQVWGTFFGGTGNLVIGTYGTDEFVKLYVQGTAKFIDQVTIPAGINPTSAVNKAQLDAITATTVTATVDFEATPPNSSDFKPVAFTGAAVGDAFIVGATSLATTNYSILARCTTAGTVSLVFFNNDSTATVNPSSTNITIKKLP